MKDGLGAGGWSLRVLTWMVGASSISRASRWRYAMALVVLLFAFGGQWMLLRGPNFAPFVFFYFGIVLASWLGGYLVGFLSVVLSALLANYFFIDEPFAFSFSTSALVATGLFVLGSEMISWVSASLVDAMVHAQQAADALRRQAELLQLSHDAIFVWRLDGPIESWNCGAAELYGWSAQEAIGRVPHKLLRTSSSSVPTELDLRTVLCANGRWEGTLSYTTKDGQRLTVAARLQLVRGDDGVARVLETSQDVTEQRRAEERIRRLNQDLACRNAELDAERRRWRGVVQSMADEVWLCDEQGKLSILNFPVAVLAGVETLEGWSTDQVLEQVEILEVDGKPRCREQTPLFRSLRGETVRGDEVMRHRGTKVTRFRQYSSAPLRDTEGAIRGAVALVRDVTESKRVEAALRDSEERFRALADNIPQLVWMVEQGTISWYNQRWLDFTGLSLREMIALGWQRLSHPEHAERVVAKLQACMEAAEVWEDTFPLRERDGTYRWFLCRAVPIRSDQHRGMRWVGTSTDITEQREADRRKDDFLAVLSHELRNPLAPIRNSLHVMERAEGGSAQAHRARMIIERQVHLLTRLVEDLLDVSRISRGKIVLQRESMDLVAVVNRTLEDYASIFAARKITLRRRMAVHPVPVNVDAARLAQVVGNLLHNAAKFTPEEGHVEVELATEGRHAVVRVRDSGVGIKPQVLSQLFQPFIQDQQALDRRAGGLGLGLALVKSFVELHGGQVQVTSEGVGGGAEFSVWLPLDRAVSPMPAHDPLASDNVVRRRVLVIEDNVDGAETLKEALELDGHEVTIAYDGISGLEKARTWLPEVVLCDIGLPGMDGYVVARAFRADPTLCDIALVALTGYALAEDKQHALDAGFDQHMAKPPDLTLLQQLVVERAGRGPS